MSLNRLMPVYPVLRKNVIQVFVSDEELKLFKRMAEKEKMKMSDYVRTAVICDACLELDKDAWKLTFKGASRIAKDLFRRKLKLRDKDVSKVI
jgi:hypothetical protein